MWIYVQRTGELRHGDLHIATGYSGHNKAKNDTSQQSVVNMGPIPQGAYLIGSLSEDASHGPLAFHLVPQTGTNTFGRGGFLMHGDSKESPGSASHGCIIMPRDVREKVFSSPDRLLLVVSGR